MTQTRRSRRSALVLTFIASTGTALWVVACDGSEEGASSSSSSSSSSGDNDATTGDSSSSTDGTAPAVDTGSDTSSIQQDAGSDAALDADATADAAADADANADADADASSDAGLDATGPVLGGELLSPANCPRQVVHFDGTLYWSETNQPGLCPGQPSTPGIRKIDVAGSPGALPPQIYVGGAGVSAPIGLVTIKAGLFFADNQGPHNDLWYVESDGGATRWGIAPGPIAPFAVTSDGNVLYWTSASGTHLTTASAPSSQVILSTGSPGFVEGVQSVAMDADQVYAIRNQPPKQGLYACTINKDCSAAGAVVLADQSDLQAVTVDADDVWMTGGNPTFVAGGITENLYRCSRKSGCGAVVTPYASTSTATNGNGTHQAIAVDTKYIYWSTIGGLIQRCDKSLAVCNNPEVLEKGTRAVSFAQDDKYLYWADRRGGIYRILK